MERGATMAKSQFRMLRSAVAGVEAVAAETSHSFARHTHEQFGIGLISSGAQKSLSGRGMVEAGAGDVITENPNEVHDGTPIGEGRSWRILYFDPGVIGDQVSDITEGEHTTAEIPHPVLRDRQIASQFEALFAAVTQPRADGMSGEERLLRLVAGVVSERPPVGRSLVPGSIRIARDMIDDDPAAAVSLADLAKASSLSRFQVLRGFAKATGMTPHAYLVQRRIHLARRMIAHGLPLAEVAFASGFADQSHMTRVFIKKYGISPRAYADAMM
jgi:AraC-like DNA-binding protein/quercetin dioxygenase-like cupin family protein